MKAFKLIVLVVTVLAVSALVYQPNVNRNDIPNRLPEAAPYNYTEAKAIAPPYEDHWAQEDNPGQCYTCHATIFSEWNGSMMSNSWRDPIWRAAFFALSKAVSASGECDTPEPPDGTEKAVHNPFANKGECSSTFDIGTEKYKVSRSGSLLDAFCSRCHMPTNYIDNIPLRNVKVDDKTGLENARVDPNFNPTSDNGTGVAFATLESQYRNTDTGKSGIICAVCHTYAETRDTPWHNYVHVDSKYTPVPSAQARNEALPVEKQDIYDVPDKTKQNLGYSIGAGSYRLSPHAITYPERFGPLAANTQPGQKDEYTSGIFKREIPYQQIDSSKHKGFHQAMFIRAEMCAACHDVTNALPIKNPLGHWVGGFPIERTYTEWANSAYAERPGNSNYNPALKRDCQSCHMQQDYGQPGTANTLYKDGQPLPPPNEAVANDGKPHPFFTHHFVGGNAYITRLIGKDVDQSGNVAPYPELSAFSFSSADEKSLYSRGFWTHLERKGAYSQQVRMAWDRLRHVLDMDMHGPATAQPNTTVPLQISIQNTGSGHKFPTGFPEGRTAWLALHAYDLSTGKELQIQDKVWNRISTGIGNLTTEEMVDPNFPGCNWKIPAGSADPYSMQFKAIATLGTDKNGKECPTLDLPYAQPRNMKLNSQGMPVDANGKVIDKNNSLALPVFEDKNGNGDLFDDAYLRDWRIPPRGNPGNVVNVDRYSVVVPPGTKGPIAVSAAMYYQSVEGIVALHFLGNMADTNNNFILEPCVLGGLCDGRHPNTEPAVVEGAPPVPMVVKNWVITVDSTPDKTPLRVGTYPLPNATQVYQDAVAKVTFSKPVRGVNAQTFTLTDSKGKQVPAWVDQIGDGTWGLFPNPVILTGGETYTARLKSGICDQFNNCTRGDMVWKFTVSKDPNLGYGDSSIPMGFPGQFPVTSPNPPPQAVAASHKPAVNKPVRIATK
ncbi:MAG TPA: Ig-like domain-containing protein [Candidatus Angelobacter sp.]|jgi:hypothetical protein|nr:Ig-like domain-containing protein [Candidatus Angelobacter sp.]